MMLYPLELRVKQYGEEADRVSAICMNLARSLPEFRPALVCNDGTFVVAGAGPSLPHFVEDIRAERGKGRPICSVKGSHDFLCEHGIEPDLFVSCDPRARVENVARKNQNTIYLIASRCSTELFDHLTGEKVVMWHSWNDDGENKALAGRFCVGGGTTSGMRAIHLGYCMGFRNFSLHGFDSCLAEDGKTKRFTGEQAGQTVEIVVGQKQFICNGALASQAQEFQLLYQVFPDASFHSSGHGLISEIILERARQGKRV